MCHWLCQCSWDSQGTGGASGTPKPSLTLHRNLLTENERLEQLPAITDRPVRLGVLISGGGTTLLNFLECIKDRSLPAEVPLVISSRPDWQRCAARD